MCVYTNTKGQKQIKIPVSEVLCLGEKGCEGENRTHSSYDAQVSAAETTRITIKMPHLFGFDTIEI